MSNRFQSLIFKLVLFFLCASVYLYAQEEEPVNLEETSVNQEEKSPPEVEIKALTPEQNRIDMDIRTSTLSELAAWCRSLGLSEGGTSADLARRLREYLKVVEQAPQSEDKRKIITIESARSSEYFKIETIDEDYARLSGEVRISLKDGDAIHRIRAWNILFNRTRNILTASGGVEYIKEEGEKKEIFRGESITVDIDNWSSIFLGGVSERSLQSDNTTYQFAGTVISRDEEEVTILSRASISTANNPESLWSLNASRVWLLPGSDFAIFNALLKVGEIPVLYIPFFYYPADEVIFHPVVGFRTREGSYVQTTTYILGRPKATSSSESSLTKILGNSNDMEKKREGLFLRSTGKKAVDPNTTSLKALVDLYANLGAYIGTELELPSMGILGPFNLSMGVGVTRTLVEDGGSYTPYYPDYDGTSDWNKSNLFGGEVPFRYRLETNSSINGKYGSVSWNLPFYSDPLVNSDFVASRAEEMDWVNMIQQGAAMEEEISTQNQLGNYSWQLSGQITPKFPNMSPYINNLSINTISSSVLFRTLPTAKYGAYSYGDPPSALFYGPETATLYSLSGSISGTPLRIGGTPAAQTNAQTASVEQPDPLLNIGIPRSPFEDKEDSEAQKKDQSDKLVPPELNQRFDLPRTGINRFSVDYRIAPAGNSTLNFDYAKWQEYGDINWGDTSSVLSHFSGDAGTTLNFSHSENFYSTTFSYTGNWTWKEYWYMNEDSVDYQPTASNPDPISAAKKTQYQQSFFSTSYNLTTALRPLYLNPIFAASSLQYTLKGLAVRSKFKEDATGDDPEWEMIYGEWTKEKIDSHQLSTTLSALVMDKTQTFSMTAELPPRDAVLAFRTGLRIWITETDANWRIRSPTSTELINGADDKWKLEPFNATERIVFGTYGSFTQTIALDTENRGEITSLTSALNLPKWGITASYAAARMLGYEYIPRGDDASNPGFEGWRQRQGEAKAGDPNFTLRSRDFSLSFSKNISMKELLNNRLQFTVNTSSRLFMDLQQYTRSNLTFSLGLTVGINKFLDLALSANSENASIYRYLKDTYPFNTANIDIPDGDQNNFFLDLFNSFAFGNEDKRRSSGFKMKSFRISATHYLGDWNAILNWTIVPYLPPARPGESRKYEMDNQVSFLLQWIPISEIKTDVTYNKRITPEWTVKQ